MYPCPNAFIVAFIVVNICKLHSKKDDILLRFYCQLWISHKLVCVITDDFENDALTGKKEMMP